MLPMLLKHWCMNDAGCISDPIRPRRLTSVSEIAYTQVFFLRLILEYKIACLGLLGNLEYFQIKIGIL